MTCAALYGCTPAPVFYDFLRFRQVSEPVLIQALCPELAIKAFNVTILHGLAWVNEDVFNLVVICPRIHYVACKFGAVIREDLLGHPAEYGNPV